MLHGILTECIRLPCLCLQISAEVPHIPREEGMYGAVGKNPGGKKEPAVRGMDPFALQFGEEEALCMDRQMRETTAKKSTKKCAGKLSKLFSQKRLLIMKSLYSTT